MSWIRDHMSWLPLTNIVAFLTQLLLINPSKAFIAYVTFSKAAGTFSSLESVYVLDFASSFFISLS